MLAAMIGKQLLQLKFSRGDETEADIVGLELAARAGYDPRAGVTVWRQFSEHNRREPLEFLSDHPIHAHREDTIRAHLKETLPLYARAKAKLESEQPEATPSPD
ncbi:MAG: hypothetical protein C5B49_00180 [Bdellovibrio sp.]|nr:MAG: hypothetical protein C5B49_00180 [Bdellovibrio sp.]